MIKATLELLRIGMPVKEYPSQEWLEYVREIDNEYIYISSNTLPNMRTKIKISKLGKEFNELWIEEKYKGFEQLCLF